MCLPLSGVLFPHLFSSLLCCSVEPFKERSTLFSKAVTVFDLSSNQYAEVVLAGKIPALPNHRVYCTRGGRLSVRGRDKYSIAGERNPDGRQGERRRGRREHSPGTSTFTTSRSPALRVGRLGGWVGSVSATKACLENPEQMTLHPNASRECIPPVCDLALGSADFLCWTTEEGNHASWHRAGPSGVPWHRR